MDEEPIACAVFDDVLVVALVVAFFLVLHHFLKHHSDLRGTDRCFQPEDVVVFCKYGRFSHEMFVVGFLLVALVMLVVNEQMC